MNILQALEKYGSYKLRRLTSETIIVILTNSTLKDIKDFLLIVDDEDTEQIIVLFYKQLVKRTFGK